MSEKIETWISILGGLCAAFKWVYEYTQKLKWEKNKFLLEQLEDFHDLESTRAMETMLDWNGTEIEYDEVNIFIDDDILYEAFQTHDTKHKFTKKEFVLRSIFDDYFDDLTRLIFMAESDLIEKKNLVIFMQYWFRILAGKSKSKSPKLMEQIHKYLEFYDYDTLLNFLKKEI